MICRDDITNLKTDIDGKVGQKIMHTFFVLL